MRFGIYAIFCVKRNKKLIFWKTALQRSSVSRKRKIWHIFCEAALPNFLMQDEIKNYMLKVAFQQISDALYGRFI